MERIAESIEGSERIRNLLLASSPDRPTASRYLDSFIANHPESALLLDRMHSGWQCLIAVFSHSRFLSEEVLQHPEWIVEVSGAADLRRVLSRQEYSERLLAFLGPSQGLPSALLFAVFRRKELLRILLRDVLGWAQLAEVTEELSNLADAVLEISYGQIRAEMVRRHGRPGCVTAGVTTECGFSVIALGKLGGRELNYSSDIDLMFVYSGNGETDGRDPITNKEFFKKVANLHTEMLSTYTSEGLCYRVDLRLRPDGRLGEVCLSLEGAKAYYEKRARDWELQMLIKARVAAGEPGPGRELLDSLQTRIYSSTLDFSAVEAVSATRVRIHEKLSKKKMLDGIDVKLARGGIRDIEFLVQCLQRLHGGREPWVRHGGTLMALRRLHDKDLIFNAEYSRLATAYEFLRDMEHRLQVVDDRQTHVLPFERNALERLARRMAMRELGRAPSPEKLLHQLNLHLEEVQETYDRVIHSQQRLYYDAPAQPRQSWSESAEDRLMEPASNNLIRFLDERAPRLAKALAERGTGRRIPKSFEAFLERAYSSPTCLKQLDSSETLPLDTLELFENSPHFAEVLNQRPELISELALIRNPDEEEPVETLRSIDDAAELRREFQRRMLRIQAESICLGVPIFETLAATSDLADAAIGAVYHLAIEQVRHKNPPASADYKVAGQMMVIALGRLGMREFDLGSDADLNFVLGDEDAPELTFWTRVAERMIDIIAAYTGHGVMFTVDTRLRPNGREGNLVQTASTYREYLATRAEAWEGISYMKSRAVAGDLETATRFLHELQEVDWRRYGQSGRSRSDLREMRSRLEREQAAVSPLKAGSGGYYDIDFSLMYLRLRSAGIFYKVLNTPERIDILESTGLLERRDADFLRQAAAFYRALDHGLRVYSGHAEGKLPNSQGQIDILSRLVRRWTPEFPEHLPLPEELGQIRTQTREFFKRLFG